MSLSALPVDGWRSRRMGEKTEQQEVEDEFTCAGVLSGALRVLKPTVERLFGVTLSIGAEDTHSPQDGQIWLRLRGSCRDVEAAKLFVKGVVNQEAQQEVQFPEVLHCVFSGAKGLFMDCLIKNTSAHIVVGSQGCVLITGLAEPVVKAYSFIIDLVEKYRSSQGRRTDGGVGTPGESLESRRTFKVLVESLEDRHTLDLLVLPVMVKEALLDMVKQSGLDRASLDRTGSWATHRTVDEARGEPEEHRQNGNSEISRIHNKPKSHSQHSGFTPKSINGTDDMTKFATLHESYSPFSHHVIPVTSHDTQPQHSDLPERSSPQEVESEIPPQETDRLSVGNSEEFEHLLKFFTAMGFTEDVVHKVLARTGPKEASQILDLVQQEQDKYVQQKGNCDSESRNEDSVAAMTGVTSGGINESDRRGENATEEDFVLGVVKKAAATCGYREERVEEVYSNLPELNPHELLLELQRERVRESDRRRDDEKQRRGAESTRENELEAENRNKRGDQKIGVNSATFVEKRETKHARGKSEESPEQLNTAKWTNIPPDTPTSSQNTPPIHVSPVPVRGPPQTKYPSKLSLETLIPDDIPSKTHPINPQSSRHPQSVPQNLPIFSNLQHQPKHSQGKASATAAVTGRQRFLESLNMPFRLQLSDDPGDPTLRYIIIDGSNVAMSHGLGLFFSCRGIALAVQHFWGRGHRKITVFVPQWRLKKHPNIKEQNYLTELQDLGLLSCTPSREVEGKRINSYDDRFMLNLAQTTNGVIVTNDNLRDLVDESTAWRDIVKRSLLQYLFAGDLFMIPDDPMGRGGPHLNDFLHAQSSSSSVPASHSFAGVSSSLPSPAPAPRAHTEVLQYRDRTPGGKSHTRGQGSLREEASDRSQPRERTLEETLNLKLSLKSIFPEQERVIIMILQSHPTLRDINRLSHFILEQQN